MKKIKSLIALILCLSVFSGCGREKEDAKVQESPAPVSAEGAWQGKAGCFRMDILRECGGYGAKMAEGTLVIAGEQLTDGEGKCIYPDYVFDYSPVSDGVWIVDETGWVDGEFVDGFFAAKYSLSGEELLRIPLDYRADRLALIPGGGFFTYSFLDGLVHRYSAEGDYCGHLELSDVYVQSLISDGRGTPWLIGAEDEGDFIAPLDAETMSMDTAYLLPRDLVNLYPGDEAHAFLYTTDTGIVRWEPETDVHEQVLFWEECFISGAGVSSLMADGEGYLCLSGSFLARISPAEADEIKPRTKITLGCMMNKPDIVLDFNAQSADYYVEMVDYCEGISTEAYENAMLKLGAELGAGEGPDLLSYYKPSFGANGLVMDIYPFIDADPTIGREDFYTLEATAENGSLYHTGPGFIIMSHYALTDTVGDRLSWSWEDFFAMSEALPEGGSMMAYTNAEAFLHESMQRYIPYAINWEDASCNFDNPEFIRILEAALEVYDPNVPAENNFFVSEVQAMMSEGTAVLDAAWIHGLQDFVRPYAAFGRDISYIGWPTPDGSSGNCFRVDNFCINASTDCPEGCWEFIKYAMTHCGEMYFPIYKPLLDKQIKDAQKGDSPLMTEAQAEDFYRLVESIGTAAQSDEAVWNIVIAEARSMFAGDKSPEDTARAIQSKVSIYVAEQA